MGALPRLRGPAHEAAARVNRHEISAWRWIAPETLTQELAVKPEHYTPGWP